MQQEKNLEMDALQIALCDDETAERELLEQYIREWGHKQSRSVTVFSFSDGEALLASLERNSYDIALLDIQMQKLDGMQTARRIRQSGDSMGIFFVTGYEDYLAEGYEVEAFRYLLKPVDREKLEEALNAFLLRRRKKPGFCTLETPKGRKRVALSDILYLEAFGHTCMLHGRTESFTVKMGISAALEQMNGMGLFLFRCHRSYLVNIAQVTDVEKDFVILSDATRIPVSRKAYQPLNHAFIQYFRKDRSGEV